MNGSGCIYTEKNLLVNFTFFIRKFIIYLFIYSYHVQRVAFYIYSHIIHTLLSRHLHVFNLLLFISIQFHSINTTLICLQLYRPTFFENT